MFDNTPCVAVSNTFPFTLLKLQEVFGGTIKEREGSTGRAYFQWRLYGKGAIELIHQVRPYLWEKLPQADLVLRIRDTAPGRQREGLVAQLKQLKRLDYS
jgi:hypothetical protein